ncbi:intrinsic membrane protein PufX [Hasllibacter halocynthiae]|uniref:Intrinsic membrane protein PufX n=1 Tax=Hasllibacter halocynthiae TaxID=595589 RepID=A0A2T0X2X4_9RHOB|nr:RC-LH1 core complex protein PufX [Hasllibacter halocynthiae]PRY93281.1 intrinsic membrane protein PufX [Hasllibacter halocynthiae]
MDEVTTPLGTGSARRSVLRQQGMGLMLRGALYGAIAFFGPILFIVGLWLVGQLLPEESKLAPDPTPESSVPWLAEVPAFA